MNREQTAEIIEKYNHGTATQEEINLVENWFILESRKRQADPLDLDYLAIKDKVWESVSKQTPARTRNLWPRIAAAAAILLVIGAGITLYLSNLGQNTGIKSSYTNDIGPGKIGATLTLANGKKIRLADAANGEIAKQAGISVTKTADGQLVYQIKKNAGETGSVNTLSTTKGETYMVILPDKSKVWLNAASSLTYSTSLNDEYGKRSVKLTGEAYFEISKDKAHPFVVKTNKQEVEVLGTHFNVNSYADESATATTLIEGSVKVAAGNLKQILKPGQQALNDGSNIKVTQPDTESITDWKNGDFYLNHIDLKTAMRKISRWYDVEFIYDSSVPDDLESGGWISRNNNLSSVLELIESSGLVHFKVEGRKIYVTK